MTEANVSAEPNGAELSLGKIHHLAALMGRAISEMDKAYYEVQEATTRFDAAYRELNYLRMEYGYEQEFVEGFGLGCDGGFPIWPATRML